MKLDITALRREAGWAAADGEPGEATHIPMANEEVGSCRLPDGFNADGDDLEVEARIEIRAPEECGVKISVERELPPNVVAYLLRKAAEMYDRPSEDHMANLAIQDVARGNVRRGPDGSLWMSENFFEFLRETFPRG